MSALSTLLVIVAVACLLLMVILLSIATRHAREVRSSIFPIVREEGAARVRRARLSATIAAVVAAVAAVAFAISGPAAFPVVLPSVPEMPLLSYLSPTDTAVREPTPTATPQPLSSPTQIAATLTPTESPPEPSPTATSTPTNAPTPPPAADTPVAASPTSPPATMPVDEGPSAAVTPSAIPPSMTVTVTETTPAGGTPTTTPGATSSPTPAASPLPAPAGAQLGPITFALAVDDRQMAVNPGQVFSDTANRVFAVFPFSGMRKGLTWTQVWFINGAEFAREQSEWQWGSQSYSYIFVKPVGAGEYRLDLYVNDQLLTSGKFTLLGPTAIGGPTTP